MDEKEENYIEIKAIAGSMIDTAVRIVNDYPDLPEEVMNFMMVIVDIFTEAEASFNRPQTEVFINELIEEM